MSSAKTLVATFAMVAAAASPALASWHWVDDEPTTRVETRVYEERQAPPPSYEEEAMPPSYYEQQPRTYYKESYAPVVVTDRETFRDGRCDVPRTHLSDGSTSDERVCSRLMMPHEFIIDRVGRAFDHLRGY